MPANGSSLLRFRRNLIIFLCVCLRIFIIIIFKKTNYYDYLLSIDIVRYFTILTTYSMGPLYKLYVHISPATHLIRPLPERVAKNFLESFKNKLEVRKHPASIRMYILPSFFSLRCQLTNPKTMKFVESPLMLMYAFVLLM